MLIRIVRMHFTLTAIPEFLTLFDTVAPKIRRVEGCLHLELWQDVHQPEYMATYSHWKDEEALNLYRKSMFFKETWAKTKVLFASPPEAISYQQLEVIS